jgi:hypothetical protein
MLCVERMRAVSAVLHVVLGVAAVYQFVELHLCYVQVVLCSLCGVNHSSHSRSEVCALQLLCMSASHSHQGC